MHNIANSKLKADLRRKYSTYRKNIPADERERKNLKIKEKILNLSEITYARNILIYLSLKYEVDTIGIIQELWKLNKTVYSPICDNSENTMRFYSFDSLNQLKKGRFSILEPPYKKENYISVADADVCIIPGLSFDIYGYRLGYGGGFYDRYISNSKIIKIGLCYSECLTDKLPHNDFDIAMDKVITDKQVIARSKNTDETER